MAFDGYDYELPGESAQPADPMIDPVNDNDFILSFSFDEHAIEPEAAQTETAGQQPFFPDFLEDDIYLEGPSHDQRSSDDTYKEVAGSTEGWTQLDSAQQGYSAIDELNAPLSSGAALLPSVGAQHSFGFDESLIDPALRTKPQMQEAGLSSTGQLIDSRVTTPPVVEPTQNAHANIPAFLPSALGVSASSTGLAPPPLLQTLKSRFDARHQPRNTAVDPPCGHTPTLPGFTAPPAQKKLVPESETLTQSNPGQMAATRPVSVTHSDRPSMRQATASYSPTLSGTGLQQTATPPPIPQPQKPVKKADRKKLPRTKVSANKLLVSGEDFAKKVAIKRVPLQVQQDDSDQVAANAQYWIPLIANALDANFQAQPDHPDEYTDAGLAEWIRWQEEHDNKVQGLLHAHSQPQVLVQACAFLFLAKVLEAHDKNLGPIHVLRTVAVGGSNPHLKCSERIRAAMTALEKFPIVRYDLVRVERLTDFAANPKGFGERKVENLWINYGKKKNQAPHLKRELRMQSETLAPSPAPGIMQSLTADGKSPASAHRPTTSGPLGGTAATPTPRPTASSSPGMMRPPSHPAERRMSPHPALMQPPGMQIVTHARPKATPRAQQARMSIAPSKQSQQISPFMPGMMKAGSRRATPQTAGTPGSSVVGISVDSTGRANVMMSEKAMGKKRKVDDLGEDYSGEVDVRGGKRCG